MAFGEWSLRQHPLPPPAPPGPEQGCQSLNNNRLYTIWLDSFLLVQAIQCDPEESFYLFIFRKQKQYFWNVSEYEIKATEQLAHAFWQSRPSEASSTKLAWDASNW